jgi:ABC-2 type transport system ATP-binding protein
MVSYLMIEARGLEKRFGDTQAAAGVDLAVPRGHILGVLGPNGAGKSTTVRMLTTMTVPDAGTAHIGGLDVVRQATEVRRIIGVTGQDASLDEHLTGAENLTLVGELSKLTQADARRRSAELLDQFGLGDAAHRLVKTYSGGMRRRIDLAASLVARPLVLFLDEPTTGLDPASRQAMWEVVRHLVADGTTVLLTTQYLEEADALADAVAVIDHGRVIAFGSAGDLKARVGGELLEVTLSAPAPAAASALAPMVTGPVEIGPDGRVLRARIAPTSGVTTAAVRALDAAGIGVNDITVRHPSLDDVFFALTDRPADAYTTPSVPELVEA